jgi:hypothetical protein
MQAVCRPCTKQVAVASRGCEAQREANDQSAASVVGKAGKVTACTTLILLHDTLNIRHN